MFLERINQIKLIQGQSLIYLVLGSLIICALGLILSQHFLVTISGWLGTVGVVLWLNRFWIYWSPVERPSPFNRENVLFGLSSLLILIVSLIPYYETSIPPNLENQNLAAAVCLSVIVLLLNKWWTDSHRVIHFDEDGKITQTYEFNKTVYSDVR